MTAIQLVERVSERGYAVRLLDGLLASVYYAHDAEAFIALNSARAYLISESHSDLENARENWNCNQQ